MQKTILLVIAGIAGTVGLFVLAMQFGSPSSADYKAMSGAQLYSRLCAHCHGSSGMASNGTGATYRGKREFWDEASMLAYLRDPKGFKKNNPRLNQNKHMPPISSQVPMEARKRLVAHVLGMMDNLKNP